MATSRKRLSLFGCLYISAYLRSMGNVGSTLPSTYCLKLLGKVLIISKKCCVKATSTMSISNLVDHYEG